MLGGINSLLNLIQILRMIMSHMHQEGRKMFITHVNRTIQSDMNKRRDKWLGFGAGTRVSLGLWGLNFPSGARGFLMGCEKEEEGGFEGNQGSNIKNEARPLIRLYSSYFDLHLKI